MSAEPLDHLVRASAGEPEGALVLLHGRGADEHDLVPRAPAAGADAGGAADDPRTVPAMQAWVGARVASF